MNKLDDISLIQKCDPSQTHRSLSLLADQCESAWNQAKKVSLPKGYHNVTSILFTGMGGSAYGARIIKSLYGLEMSVPIDLISDYHIPSYVNEKTLVIAASYSGTTQETINCAKEALTRNSKLIGISAGGPLYALLHNAGKPYYRFDPKFNPCGQPRIGQGYMQLGQMAMLASLGFISITDQDVAHMISILRLQGKVILMDVPSITNSAKKLALQLENKVVNLIAGEFLEGATHAIRNPFHETGKHFANYFIVPELNHHLMEGLSFPTDIKKNFIFVLLHSRLYSSTIQNRMRLTKEVVNKNNIETIDIGLSGKTELEQVFELIQLGSFVTFYLAMLHGIDPAKIPWVDYFKEKLSAKG